MEESQKTTETLGDTGGAYILPGKGTRNARLERRAIMQRWNVRPEALQPMIERQIAIATDPEQRPRESTQAFLAVLKARGQDLEIDRLEKGIPEPKEGDTFNITQNNLTVLTQADLDAHEETKNEVLHRTHSTDEMAEQYPATDEEALAPPNYSGRFKREWFRYFVPTGRPGYFAFGEKEYFLDGLRKRFLTVDPAASVKETAKADPDWTVISAWGQTECGLLVWLGCTRVRCEVPDIIPRVAASYVRFRAGKAIIESGGTQKAVAQLARRHRLPTGAMMNVVEYNPKGRDKLDRATDMLNMASAGRLWLPQSDPTFPLAEVESELLRFTGDPKQGGKDDVVDCASIAGEEVTKGTGMTHNFIGSGKYGVVRSGLCWWGY